MPQTHLGSSCNYTLSRNSILLLGHLLLHRLWIIHTFFCLPYPKRICSCNGCKHVHMLFKGPDGCFGKFSCPPFESESDKKIISSFIFISSLGSAVRSSSSKLPYFPQHVNVLNTYSGNLSDEVIVLLWHFPVSHMVVLAAVYWPYYPANFHLI